MKSKNLITTFLFITMLFAFSGCGNSNESKKAEAINETSSVDKHPETKKLQAADAVGYDGTAIKNKVDKLLDKTEENNKKAEEIKEK